MQKTIQDYLNEYKQAISENTEIDNLRFLAWLQTKLLMEINEKMETLLNKEH